MSKKILVCLSSSPSNGKVISAAFELAKQYNAKVIALYIETQNPLSNDDQSRLNSYIEMARTGGAKIEKVVGEDIAFQIAEFAKYSNISKIVIGQSASNSWLLQRPSLIDQLINYAPDLDIFVIPVAKSVPRRKNTIRITIKDTLIMILILTLTTLFSIGIYRFGIKEANIITIYILGVLITSIFTSSKVYNVIASLFCVIMFNFLFTDPRYTLFAYDSGYLLTFFIMFLSSFITSSLASRLKEHAKESSRIAYRTKVLLDANQLLNQARSREEIIQDCAMQLQKLLNRKVCVYIDDQFSMYVEEDYNILQEEEVIAKWVIQNNKRAGANTDYFSFAKYQYYSLRQTDSVYGSVGIRIDDDPMDNFEISILVSILGECSLALENEKNSREKEESIVRANNEKLRADLLRTISHDLRTPLTSIFGNATNLLSNEGDLPDQVRHEVYQDIYDDSLWLIDMIENLLAVTRLEQGKMTFKKNKEILEDVVNEAVGRVHDNSNRIEIETTANLIMVSMDAKLVIQVIINLVNNAIKYTPENTKIQIKTFEDDQYAYVQVLDQGSGIREEDKEHIFDMFYRGERDIVDDQRGLGLGLSLCKSIVLAHGGQIVVKDNEPVGSIFEFSLLKE